MPRSNTSWKQLFVLFCFVFPRIMHDEVSETENIRKNLAIERMIVEGCEILLDTSQTFVRQGNSPNKLISYEVEIMYTSMTMVFN